MQRKTILIDVDEVICNSALIDILNDFLKTNYKLDDFKEYYMDGVVPEDRKEEFYNLLAKTDCYQNAHMIDGAIETIEELSKHYEILICSSCVMFYNMQGSGIYFKHKYDFLLRTFPFLDPHKFILTGYKNCLVADVQIDDRLDNLYSKNVKTKLLMTAYHNKEISNNDLKKNGVIRVNSWAEIKDLLLSNIEN